jgi:hypothetical protein
MKRITYPLYLACILFAFGLSSCEKDTEEKIVEVAVDSAQPNGQFTALRSGSFVDENGAGSMGNAALGTDAQGTQFLMFNNSFTTNFGTGTVTVYLSTSSTFTADPPNGNPDLFLVGPVKAGGQQYFKLNPAAPAKFTHVILWCGSASIPFGYAALN